MSIEITKFSDEYAAQWDTWCAAAGNATFLQTRKFLSYHGERFEDASALLMDDGRLVGVIPAAALRSEATTVVSHAGATYGGIVHQGWLSGERMVEGLSSLRDFYRKQGYLQLIYKPLPHIYATTPSQDDLYALFRLGARRVRCDLSCSIDLSQRRAPSDRRKRGFKKAMRQVTLTTEHGAISSLWGVLEENLKRKHSAAPVHTLVEIQQLISLFPQDIQIRCAMIDGNVEAGIVLFNSHNVWHAQYIASSEKGYEASALDAVFESAIAAAHAAGMRYFDFGTSNESDGTVLNDGLYRFKSEFGGGGVVHEYYNLDLSF